MTTRNSTQTDRTATAGLMLGTLDRVIRTAYDAGLIDDDTLALAYGGLVRHELLERSRHPQTTEAKESIEARLSNPEAIAPPWPRSGDTPHTHDEFAAWLVRAADAAHWTASAQIRDTGDSAVHQHIIRIAAKDGTVHRIGLSNGWRLYLTEHFDSIFQEPETSPETSPETDDPPTP